MEVRNLGNWGDKRYMFENIYFDHVVIRQIQYPLCRSDQDYASIIDEPTKHRETHLGPIKVLLASSELWITLLGEMIEY